MKLKIQVEVFNKSHDTEAILEGYKIWGTDILNKLEGQFSFVIFDKINQTLFMARDRLGRNLYFTKLPTEELSYHLHLSQLLNFRRVLKLI